MLVMFSLIISAVTLVLLITFFVVFLVVGKNRKKELSESRSAIGDKIAELSALVDGNHVSMKTLLNTYQKESTESCSAIGEKIAELSALVDDNHVSAKNLLNAYLIETQNSAKATQEHFETKTTEIQTQVSEDLKGIYNKFISDSMSLKKDIGIRLDNILSEIKAPLDLE